MFRIKTACPGCQEVGSETILLFFWAPQKQRRPCPGQAGLAHGTYDVQKDLTPLGPGTGSSGQLFFCRKEDASRPHSCPDPAPSSLHWACGGGFKTTQVLSEPKRGHGWVLGPVGRVGSEVRRLGPCLPPTGPGQPWVAQASGFHVWKGVCFPGQRCIRWRTLINTSQWE